jgi:hypothetical protein
VQSCSGRCGNFSSSAAAGQTSSARAADQRGWNHLPPAAVATFVRLFSSAAASAANTRAEARRIAINIRKLPEMLGRS